MANILHPDVIVEHGHSCRTAPHGPTLKKEAQDVHLDPTATAPNYELIEYLKRREKQTEELLKRMDAREDRLMNLLERTVVAIETLAVKRALTFPVNPIKENAPATARPLSPPPEAQFAAPPATQEQPTSPERNGIATGRSGTIPVANPDAAIEVPDDGDSGDDVQVKDKLANLTPKAGGDDRTDGRQT
ncbi:GM16184 [Drosophila sechellia]|uniref:GM16184 n=1 Tax=Drosophila sechellia TaxID=7238 RepID=B4IQQ2_DROSE|nr:GM16184 [Drosophila sechellia]